MSESMNGSSSRSGVAGLNVLSREIFLAAVRKGFWGPDRGFPEVTALIHSEVSEALEEYRNGNAPDHIYYSVSGDPSLVVKPRDGKLYVKLDGEEKELTDSLARTLGVTLKPEGVPVELADILIRVLDACGAYGINIERALEAKMAYNLTRNFRHGKVC